MAGAVATAAVALVLTASACSSSPTEPGAAGTASAPGAPGPTGPAGTTTGGSSDVGDRADAVRSLIESEGAIVHRVVVDGDLVAVHAEVPQSETVPNGPLAQVLLLRLSGDVVVERKATAQAVPDESINGHTMFDGGGDPGAPASASDLAANRDVASRFLTEVLGGANPAAIDELVGPIYTQHNPAVGDGVEALRTFVGTLGPMEVTIDEVVAQGDLVVAWVHYGDTIRGADIFRIADGRIVEHWDVLGPVAGRDPLRSDGAEGADAGGTGGNAGTAP